MVKSTIKDKGDKKGKQRGSIIARSRILA